MKTTYKVKTIIGEPAQLWSDDTYTLHFGEGFDDQMESTPDSLAHSVSANDLHRIATLENRQDSRKAWQATLLLKSKELFADTSLSHTEES